MKIPFVAATTLVAYNLKAELGAEVLQKAGEILQKHIDSGSWREVKLVLRFLGGLQPLFEGDGIFSLLEELFARAVDLQTASSEDVSGLYPQMDRPKLTVWRSYLVWSLSRSFCSLFLM
jgi:nuclear cap-binding protein subunit 1